MSQPLANSNMPGQMQPNAKPGTKPLLAGPTGSASHHDHAIATPIGFSRWMNPDLVAGVFCLMLMLTNLTSMGLVWDEPFYLEPKSWMNRWLGDVAKGLTGDGDRLSKAFGEKRRREDWRCCEKHPSQYVHPPVASLASLLGWKLSAGMIGDLAGHRLVPAIIFALAGTIIFRLTRTSLGIRPAIVAMLAWLIHPHLFAFGRIATPDGSAASLAFITAASAWFATRADRRYWWFGLLAGLTFMTKGPSVLVVAASLVWILWHRPKRVPIVLMQLLLLGGIVVWLANPAWWTRPIAGLADYVEGMRVFKQHQQVPTYFRGTIYRSDLPWYNVPMLLLATTPPAMLTLMGVGVIGLLGCVRPRSSESAQPTSPVCSIAIWSLLHAIIFLALRASPFSPGNDSIRHFLPAYGFLACLAGAGWYLLESLLRRVSSNQHRIHEFLSTIALFIMITPSVSSWYQHRAIGLTYFSELIGGARGAGRLGLETTYFWDVADPSLLNDLNQLPPNSRVGVPVELRIFNTYQAWGMLRKDLIFDWPKPGAPPFDYYLFIRREGMTTAFAKEKLDQPAPVERSVGGVRVLVLVPAL